MTSDAQPPSASLPPLVVAGCAAFCLGIGTGVAGWAAVHVGLATSLTGLAGLAGASILCRARRPAVAGALLVLAFGLGLARGGTGVPHHAAAGPASAGGPVVVQGHVRDAPVARRGESLVIVEVDRVAGSLVEPGAAIIVRLLGRSDALPGDEVRLEASSLRDPGSRPGPLSASTLDREGVDAVAVSPRVTVLHRGGRGLSRALAVVRRAIATSVDSAVAAPRGTLLDAVAFGIRGQLPADQYRELRDSGLIHLVATSGLKVAIVAGLAARLLTVVAAAPRTRVVVSLAAIAAYVAIGGGGSAALRSSLMAGAGLVLLGSGRRLRTVPLLACLASLFLAVDPRLCTDAGFQLTFLGTLGIVVLAAPIAARLPGPRLLVEPFAVTAAAQLATLPVMGSTFGVIALGGPVANALSLPLVPPLIVLAWLGAGLAMIVPSLGAPALLGAELLTAAIERVASLTASMPGSAVQISAWPRSWTLGLLGGAAVTAGLRVAWRRDPDLHLAGRVLSTRWAGPLSLGSWQRQRRSVQVICAGLALFPVAALLVAGARPDGRLHVDVLAVGSGPAVLVRTASGGTALVDAGSDPARLLEAIQADLPALASGIDLLVLTGGERAAVAGLVDLAANHRVARVVVPQDLQGSAARAAVLDLRARGASVTVIPEDARWSWGGAAWRCLGDGLPDPAASAAAPRCALQVADSTGSALLLGDLPPPGQDELTALRGDGLRADLLVAPPSGLVTPALLMAAHPSQVAIPSSRTPSVHLEVAGIQVHTTAEDGTLRYQGGPQGLVPV